MPLSSFSPRVREWFEGAFAAPTPAQAQAWPAIARGEHVLVSAPTGSGKTLAAFLWALDRLSVDGESSGAGGAASATRVVYVSPLKALAYDIERNLRAPLRGIGAEEVRVGIRTGDTPQRERAAMARKPPDILITTPESLYLILTSQAREMLRGVEAVIVDEIHAVAALKARLAPRAHARAAGARSARGRPVAADRPERDPEPARGDRPLPRRPRREVTIVDAGARKQLDLRIEVPVESMTEPGGPIDAAADPAGAGRAAASPRAARSGRRSTRSC